MIFAPSPKKDFPNVWAPNVYWMVEYFRNTGQNEVALDIAKRFFSTVYQGWVKTNYIFEKYNADELGVYGGGGEYVVQEGFGWTNGVVIKFIEWFGDELKIEPPPTISIQMDPLIEEVENEKEAEIETEATTSGLLTHSQSTSNQSVSAESNESSESSVVVDSTVKSLAESRLDDAAMLSVFGTDEQVKRRMSEVISNEISNEISISIQHMEI